MEKKKSAFFPETRILSARVVGSTFWKPREAGEEHCCTYRCPASWHGDPINFGFPMLRVRGRRVLQRFLVLFSCANSPIYIDTVCSRPVGGIVLAAYCIERARTTRSLSIERWDWFGRRESLELQAGQLRSLRGSPSEYSQDPCIDFSHSTPLSWCWHRNLVRNLFIPCNSFIFHRV